MVGSFFLWAEIRHRRIERLLYLIYIYRCFVGVFRAILYQPLAYCLLFTQTLVNDAKSCPKRTIHNRLDIKLMSCT